jgi:hypothetical protein
VIVDVCEAELIHGPRKGQPARGTARGYRRHREAGELACEECAAAIREAKRERNAKKPKPETPLTKRSSKYPSPEPKTTGLPKRRSIEPQTVGRVMAVCGTCGARGLANAKLLGTRARVVKVPVCAECRT